MKMKSFICILVLIACVIAVAGVVPRNLRGQETGKAGGPAGWQALALVQSLSGGLSNAELAAKINQLGRDGWELVSVENFVESGTTSKTGYYFKRRL